MQTGLVVSLPSGVYARIALRSGLVVKKFIDVGAGVIDSDCCALCPGVVDWHNYGIVLGVLESSLGISLDEYLHSVTFYVGMGPR